MAYETFPWDDLGDYWDIQVEDETFVLSTPFNAGYYESRALTTRMPKIFKVNFKFLTEAEWFELVTFFRTVHGPADAFYFQYPYGVAGRPGFGGAPLDTDPIDGFNTEITVGAGKGPIFLVRFTHKKLPQKRLFPRYWASNITVRQV